MEVNIIDRTNTREIKKKKRGAELKMSDLRQRKPGDSEATTPVTESRESDQVNYLQGCI